MQFTYNAAGRLTTITHEDGAQTQYGYNASGLLSTVTNVDGRMLEITYTAAAPYRVTKVQERNGAELGAARSYAYGDRVTVVKDETVANGKKLTYTFNENGNVIAVHDMLGHAKVTKYNKDLPLNHPESRSKMQRSIVNLLKDHSFEDGDTSWTRSSGVTIATSGGRLGPKCLYFNNSTGVEMTARQNVTLTKGKGVYTDSRESSGRNRKARVLANRGYSVVATKKGMVGAEKHRNDPQHHPQKW